MEALHNKGSCKTLAELTESEASTLGAVKVDPNSYLKDVSGRTVILSSWLNSATD